KCAISILQVFVSYLGCTSQVCPTTPSPIARSLAGFRQNRAQCIAQDIFAGGFIGSLDARAEIVEPFGLPCRLQGNFKELSNPLLLASLRRDFSRSAQCRNTLIGGFAASDLPFVDRDRFFIVFRQRGKAREQCFCIGRRDTRQRLLTVLYRLCTGHPRSRQHL